MGIQQMLLAAGIGYVANLSINADTNNYDLRAQALAAGWDGVVPLIANVTIANGVVVGSSGTGSYAFTTTATAYPNGSRLNLSIGTGAYIIGAGGNGASGDGADDLRPGQPGGPGLKTNLPTFISGAGIIGGGGGGSARSGYGGSNGGRGAGGCGRVVGQAIGSGPASSGSLTQGGTTQTGHVNGLGNAPNTTSGNCIGNDGDTGAYGGAGGRGGNAIDGFANCDLSAFSGQVLGRTT